MRSRFAYHRPTTVEEACEILVREPRAVVIAGGTDLLVHLRALWPDRGPSAVVNIKRIPGLAQIEFTHAAVRLGALASLAALMEHSLIGAEYPVLPYTARFMGSPAIRNLATVGGNLCNASPAADLPPVLLALDAEVAIVGPRGDRRLSLEQFFRGPGDTVLGPGELLLGVEFPRRSPPRPITYERLDVRRAMDIAIAGAALCVEPEGDRIREARVALSAVAPTPRRVRPAEAALVEGGLSDEAIACAAELCMAAAQPIDDVRATAAYRREMVAVLVRRGLERLRAGAEAGTEHTRRE